VPRRAAQSRHSPTQILVDLSKAKPGKRITVGPTAEPLKKHPRGIAILAERLLGETVDIDEPTAIAVEHLALERSHSLAGGSGGGQFGFNIRSNRWIAPVYPVRHWRGCLGRRPVRCLKRSSFRLNKTFDVRGGPLLPKHPAASDKRRNWRAADT
jgi:hypothetical protein